MKRIISIFVGFAFLISGCSRATTIQTNQKNVIDALGREVTLNGEPSRLVIIGKQAPMLTNFLYLFKSADKKLVGLEKRSQSTDDFLKLINTNIGEKYILEKGAGAEQVVPLEPDMVIMKSSMRDTIGKPFEDLSIPVVYVEFENVDQIYRDIRILADILNEKQRGEELISSYQKYYKQLQDRVINKPAEEKPTILILQAESEDQKYIFKVPAANWLQTDMVERAGGMPVWMEANPAEGWMEVNMEQISNWDAEMVYVINYQGQGPEIVDNLRNDTVWKNLKAVKNDHVFAFPYDFLSWDQPDSRWILGYGWLTLKQNPKEIFSSEIRLMVNDYYENFYGLDESIINEKIFPKIMDYLN